MSRLGRGRPAQGFVKGLRPFEARTGSVAISGGGTVTTGFLQSSASGSTVAHGGGSLATTGFKNAQAAVVTHGGGTIATVGASTQNAGFLPGVLMGGGGRTARSHPSPGITQPGMIATVIAGTTTRTGSVAISGGGTIVASAAKGASAVTAATGAGSLATAAAKGALSALAAHGGGTIVTSGAATPLPGGIIGGAVLVGGGGRFGRSHVGGVFLHAQPALAAVSADNRAGTAAGTGGGTVTTAGRKGGISTTSVSIPAPPPEFVDVLMLAGVLVHAGGSITVTYSRSASQVGSVALTGGGSIRTAGFKGAAGSTSASAGGTGALTVRKGARGATAISGGGSVATSYVLGQGSSATLGMSGGGTVRTAGSKSGIAAISMTGGGALRANATKKTSGTTTATGGGTLTLVGSQFGPQAVGVVTVHGGGTLNLSTTRLARGVTSARGGGGGTAGAVKGATGIVAISGGGSIRTIQVTVPTPIYGGLVDSEEELGSVPVPSY